MQKNTSGSGPDDPEPDSDNLVIFPTALPEHGGAVARAWSRRPGPIEVWLAKTGSPAAFKSVYHWFDVRDEAVPGIRWDGLDLSGEDLGGFDLRGASLRECVLPDITAADLSGARLDCSELLHARGTIFDEASLVDVEASCGRLDAASFRGANLQGANFAGAGLRRASFHGADLAGADFCDTDLTGSTIHLARSLEGCDLGGAFGLEPHQVIACRALGAVGLGNAVRA